MMQRELEVLSVEECFALLGRVNVGRLVYQDELGPAAIPVNFALAGQDIVIRVEGGAKRAAMGQPTIGFEADHVDDEVHAGWSVLVRGTGRALPQDEVTEELHRLGSHFPQPWAIGIHNTWLQITPSSVTGRRLGTQRQPLVFF